MHFNRRCSVLVMLNGLVGTFLTYHTAVKASYSHEATLIVLDTINSQSTNRYSLTMKGRCIYSLLGKKRISRQSCQMTYKLSIMFKGSSFFISFLHTFLRPRFIRAMLPTMWCGTTNSMMIQCPKLIRLVSSIVPSLGATAPWPMLCFFEVEFFSPCKKTKSGCTLPGWNFHIWRDNNSFTRVVVSRICLKECCQIHRDHHPFARETEIFLLAG